MNEAPKNKSGWLILRRFLIAIGILATLVAIFYTEEDWRGKRAWENYKYEWEAKGEKFDWQAFVPPSVPDDQNFFTAPVFTNMRNSKIAMTPYGKDGGPDVSLYKDLSNSEIGYLGGEGRTKLTDLKAWQTYYRNPTNLRTVIGFVMTNGMMSEQTNQLNHPADEFPIVSQPQTPAKDVLLALSKFNVAVEELRQASQRSYANVPLNYEDGFNSASTLLPILAELKICTQLLQLRAIAELADGQNDKALADVKLILHLNNALRSSPFLVCHLVRIAIVAIDLQPIWEGLAEHRWSDEQLATLEAELAKVDFLADYGFIMRGERAFAIKSFENQWRTREMVSYTDAGDVTNKLTFMPSAYFYRNELAFAQLHQQWTLPIVDPNTRVISPAVLRHAQDVVEAEKKHYSPYKFQALMLFPVISRTVIKLAAIQASIDLARVACALERYHIAHGEYPQTLDALAPQFIEKIPHDIIGGEPLHYRRKTDGQFVLYSVGWNETDDGGQIGLNKDGKFDWQRGDWVWQNPVK
jgi:tetratricopeptide (TPR) repeat protein